MVKKSIVPHSPTEDVKEEPEEDTNNNDLDIDATEIDSVSSFILYNMSHVIYAISEH